MKKYWKLLLCAAIGVGTFTACEDVPEPYNIPSENGGSNTPTADYILNKSFTSSLGDFQSESESGTLAWTASSKYGAIITGYDDFDGDGNKENQPGVTYLVSPEIDLSVTDSAYVVIEQAINYAKTTMTEDNKLLIREGEGSWADLPMNYDGLGSSFTYITQNIQIPQEYIGKTIQLALKHTAHDSYSSTWEVKSLKVAKGTAPSAQGGNTPEGLVGSGTKDDPYDVPSTIKLIAAGPPSSKIYTKGIVSKIDEIDTGSFGNATYYISNDGTATDQLEVYRGFGLGGAKFTSTDDLKVGDRVIVYGVVVYYNNKTMEFTQGSQLYMLNDEYATGGGEPSGDAEGTGTKDDPFNVAAAQAGSGNAWVKAYIVGWIEGQKLAEGAHFNANSTVASNLLIADTPDETNVANCMPVQLPGGSDARTALNLMDNPGNYKKEVMLYGSLEKYFGAAGLKSVSDYVIDGSTPGPTPEPGEAKGSGTLEDPFNPVAANAKAGELGTGATSTESYYVKGKVSQIKYTFSAQYGTATFHISEDGQKANEFYIYSTLFLENKKWVEGNTQIQVGDEVIIYGQFTNYNGTLETASQKSYIYSLNGKTSDEGGGEGGGDPQPGGDTKTLADFTNGDFESWADGQPIGWKTTSSAGNATLSQSTDAHGGSYSVQVGGTTSANKRLGYQELELEAGTYNCTFWAKAATDAAASLCPGYAVVGDNITYNYDKGEDNKNKYVNDIVQEWQQVSYSFTLAEKAQVSLIIMNSKTTGTDLLIDDFTITKQ